MVTQRNLRKQRTGTVVSNKADKSITVMVERRFPHPRYRKLVKKSTKFMAHDEKNACQIGDVVKIMETRPLSKKKCWRLIAVIKPNKTHDTTRIETEPSR